jgi:deoxyribonuclease-4
MANMSRGLVVVVKIGVHVSIAGSIDLAVDRAKERGCETFQIFTRNPRGWRFKKLDLIAVEQFKRKLESYGIGPAVAHMPYLPNISSPATSIFKRSLKTLIAELDRCEELGIPYLVTHLGSHLGKGAEIGFDRILTAINTALKNRPGEVMLLLENTAGTRHSMGTTFQELSRILDGVDDSERVGVCFDTCHAFAGGYDLRGPTEVQATMNEFNSIIGLSKLKVVHANDSRGKLGSKLDRHEHIGMGQIGNKGFKALLHYEALRELPFIMETPIDKRRDDRGNIQALRTLACSGMLNNN